MSNLAVIANNQRFKVGNFFQILSKESSFFTVAVCIFLKLPYILGGYTTTFHAITCLVKLLFEREKKTKQKKTKKKHCKSI